MREFVLNDASLPADHVDIASSWLADIWRGLSVLVHAGLVRPTLRSRRSIYEIYCAPDLTLFNAFIGLQSINRDASLFLLGMANLAPVQSDLDEILMERFLRCEAIGHGNRHLPDGDGVPLLLCAISGFIAVSLPSEQFWDRDELEVVFNELSPNGTIDELKATVNAISRSSHADTVKARLMEIDRDQVSSYTELWDQRSRLFPDLAFGMDFERHLKKFDSVWLRKTVRKLTVLNDCANRWTTMQSALPPDPWSSIVRPEGATVEKDPSLREERRFKTHDGNSELFMLHTNITKGDRLHLRIVESERLVEIGYIGPHLPTKKY